MQVRAEEEEGMADEARAAGIALRFDVPVHWQPVDSQRLMLWAGRFGRQERFLDVLNRRHFERAESARWRNVRPSSSMSAGSSARLG